MMLGTKRTCLLAMILALLAPTPLAAQNDGQEALDQALEAKASASNLEDLEEVVQLCRRALDRGLDESGQEFAEQLLAATLFQRAGTLANGIIDQNPPHPQWPQLRRVALRDLEEAALLHPEQEPIHRLIGRLHALPGGDRLRGIQALDKSLSLLAKDDATSRAEVLVTRGTLQESSERRLADLESAIELAPEYPAAYRLRGLAHLEANRLDQAVADLEKAGELEPENADTQTALGLAHLAAQDYDEALAAFDKVGELQPESPVPFASRSRVYQVQEDWENALKELDKAVELVPDNAGVKLQRAKVHYMAENRDAALKDVESVLEDRPGAPEALALRAQIRADAGELKPAIDDLERLRTSLPENVPLLLQIAHFHRLNNEFRRAIEYFTKVLEADPDNFVAYHSRADVYLSVGRQAEAIADYKSAIKIEPDSDAVLNNLAWVLATSPSDELRDAELAIELATKACELTQYKAPHILSTLAAAYAESGDFDKAVEWSTKAVEAEKERMSMSQADEPGQENIVDQLSQELASYQEKKPWREIQNLTDESADAPSNESDDEEPKSSSPEESAPLQDPTEQGT